MAKKPIFPKPPPKTKPYSGPNVHPESGIEPPPSELNDPGARGLAPPGSKLPSPPKGGPAPGVKPHAAKAAMAAALRADARSRRRRKPPLGRGKRIPPRQV